MIGNMLEYGMKPILAPNLGQIDRMVLLIGRHYHV